MEQKPLKMLIYNSSLRLISVGSNSSAKSKLNEICCLKLFWISDELKSIIPEDVKKSNKKMINICLFRVYISSV